VTREGLDVVGDGTWLTVGQAAQRLNISADSVRRAVEAGRLQAGRTPGGHRRILAESVEKLLHQLYPNDDTGTD
jgi:excisionase family DNA binding protein